VEVALVLLALALWAAPVAAPLALAAPRDVSVPELLAAMRRSDGYELAATANAARLHAEVFLQLIRAASARDPYGPPLRVGYVQWHAAFLERTGLPPERAPLFVRLALEHRQDTLIDYGVERVVRAVGKGRRPVLAANVTTSWPEAPGRPRSYSYVDGLASPQLRVTNQRVLTYRLLDLGDMIVFAEISGLRGRPVSGFLGALFDLIGEVPVVESRMAWATDGTQVARGRGRKGAIDVTTTVTIRPDGRAEKGLPPSRPDLVEIEARLKQALGFEYAPRPAVR
jgi:hypothetical protein